MSLVALLIVFSACAVSGRISRAEEREERKRWERDEHIRIDEDEQWR